MKTGCNYRQANSIVSRNTGSWVEVALEVRARNEAVIDNLVSFSSQGKGIRVVNILVTQSLL